MKPEKILIVEDEKVVALSIESKLKSIGYEVCGTAATGLKALDLAANTLPDIAIMDIKIKGEMDGIETALKLKNKYRIPVVFLTAFSDPSILKRAKIAEPLGFLIKPFNSHDLNSTIEMAIYKAKMEKKIQALNQTLEEKVKQRTRKLTDEIICRKRAEKELKSKTDFLKQANKALKSLLDNRSAEKRAIEAGFSLHVKKYILPYIELMKGQDSKQEVQITLDMLRKALDDLIAPVSKTRMACYAALTPQEVKIADFIRFGRTTKEIAGLLNISPSSVSTYRNHIRKKMGLLNSGINLENHLNSLE